MLQFVVAMDCGLMWSMAAVWFGIRQAVQAVLWHSVKSNVACGKAVNAVAVQYSGLCVQGAVRVHQCCGCSNYLMQ